MSDPALSAEENEILIAYARRKFGEERWPLSPDLRAVREAIEKLRKPTISAMQIKPHVPSLNSQRQKKRR